MSLLPVATRERGSAIVQRLTEHGVALPEPVQTSLAGLADRRALERLERERRFAVAEVVFAYYVAQLHHPLAYWTPARAQVIVNLLTLAHDDPSLLLYAIDGVSKDDWALGQHPKNQRRLENFKWLFEDGGLDRLEHYAETQRGYNQEKPHPLVVKHGLPIGGTDGRTD